MKNFWVAFMLFTILCGGIFIMTFASNEHIKNKPNKDAEYLEWALQYFVDTRTNLCYAKTSVNTLTVVTCSPEVLKIAHPIK